MITNITKENEGATITTPTNTPVVPPLNPVVIQQGQIHTQTTMSRRVINETTLRLRLSDFVRVVCTRSFYA